MALNKRERTLLITTTTLVVLGVNYFLGAYLIGRWQPLRTQLASRRRELEAMQSTIRYKSGWEASYRELGHNLRQSQQFQTANDVSKRIYELGSSAGILIQQSRNLREEPKDVYRELPVQVTFESTTESVAKFLYGIQTASGFMTVESLSVAVKSDKSNVLRCDIQIRALSATTEKPSS